MVPSCAGFAPQAGADRDAARISPNSNLNHDCFINYFSFCLLDETEGLWARHQGAFATRFAYAAGECVAWGARGCRSSGSAFGGDTMNGNSVDTAITPAITCSALPYKPLACRM